MTIDYYSRLPRLLREEFVDGRWLPIVGAGISANARTQTGKRPPMWKELGEAVRAYLPDGYGVDGPADAISTYEQMHGRPALIDRIHDALLIDDAQPSGVHRSLSRVPFDTVVTTNVDFLLETAWTTIGWPFDPIIGEQRLTAKRRALATQLIKFHGDVHHPTELVITEEDYDGFLTRFPLLATYVASLLISRVPVLFGYSLDDPDFRSILQLVGDRLGRNRSAPWVILARANQAQVARYERRGVRVVVLDKRPSADHAVVLTALFDQLAERLPGVAAANAESSQDQVLSELRLTGPDKGALVVFLGSNEYLAQHRVTLFPALRNLGLIPVTRDEIQDAPGLALASLAQLIRKAAVVVLDGRGDRGGTEELSFVVSQASAARVLLIIDEDEIPPEFEGVQVIVASSDQPLNEDLISSVTSYITEVTAPQRQGTRSERIRARLEAGDVAFALVEAVIAIESILRARLDEYRPMSFRQLVAEHPGLGADDAELLRDAYRVRSEFLHRGIAPSADVAVRMTLRLLELLDRLYDA